jgi:VanZ family protein
MSRLRFLYLFPGAAYMALIFVLSSRPAPEFTSRWPEFLGLSLIHMIEYAGLSLLLAEGLRRARGLPRRRAAALALLVAVLWGLSDEWHQSFVPSRTPSALDALSDGIGAALAALAWLGLTRRHTLPAP